MKNFEENILEIHKVQGGVPLLQFYKYVFKELKSFYFDNKIVRIIMFIFSLLTSIPIFLTIKFSEIWFLDIFIDYFILLLAIFSIISVIILFNYIVINDVYKLKIEIKSIVQDSYDNLRIKNINKKNILKNINKKKIPENEILNYWIYFLKKHQFRITVIIPAVIVLYTKIYQYIVQQYLTGMKPFVIFNKALEINNIGLFLNICIWFSIIIIYFNELMNINK